MTIELAVGIILGTLAIQCVIIALIIADAVETIIEYLGGNNGI